MLEPILKMTYTVQNYSEIRKTDTFQNNGNRSLNYGLVGGGIGKYQTTVSEIFLYS